MGVFLRAYDRNGNALGLMPDFTELSVQTNDNAAGTMTFKYLRDGVGASYLDLDELFLSVVEDGVESPDLFQLEDDTDDQVATLTQTNRRWMTVSARGYMAVLDQAVVYPPGYNGQTNLTGLKPEYKFDDDTPGQMMYALITNAKARGGLNELIRTWTGTHDSNGTPWPKKFDITLPVGTNYLQVLNNMIEDGWVDARTYGRNLQLFVPDTYFGTSPDILRYGQNVLAAPRKRSRRDIYSHMLSLGDAEKKAAFQVSRPDTAARFGRREGFVSDGNRKTKASLEWIGNVELGKHQQFKEGFTLEMVMNPPGPGEFWPRPGIDFRCGDKIYYDRYRDSAGNYQPLLVRSITKSWGDAKGAATASIEVGDLFVKQTARTAAQVGSITAGSTGVRAPAPKAPARDTMPPVAPTNVDVTGASTLHDEIARKVWRSTATATWPAVTQDSDGTELEDLDGYEVSIQINSGEWSASRMSTGRTEVIDGLKPLDTVRVAVRSKDYSGNRSDWVYSSVVAMPLDTTPPNVPTAPILTEKASVVTCRWDGLGIPGNVPMPEDFHYVLVQRSLSATFASGVLDVDRLYEPDATTLVTTQAYGDVWYYRFLAVDVNGNRSAPSAAASIATTPLVSGDLPQQVIDDITQALDDAHAANDAAVAAQETANAAATQTAFDGALTRLTATEGVATAAKSKADLAAPQTAVDNLLTDLDTNYYTKPETNSYVQQSVATKAQVIYSTSDPSGTAYNAGDIWRKVDTLANGGKILGEWTFVMPGATWTTRVYSGSVLTALDAGSITAGFLNAARIQAGALSIGQVGGLQNVLDADAVNTNPTFGAWASTAPDGWSVWASSVGPIAKETVLQRTPPNSIRFAITDPAQLRGLTTSSSVGSSLAALPLGLTYVTVSIDFMLVSGTLSGAGILFDWNGIDAGTTKYRVCIDLDAEVPAPTLNKWYRVTKTIKKPAGTGAQTAWTAFLMANYGYVGVNNSAKTTTAKDLVVDYLSVRPATTAEVAAYEAAPAATVTDLDARLASKATDLVTNGTGALGTNYNFSAFDFSGADAPTGANGSFVVKNAAATGVTLDELIPFDPSKTYRFSFQARQTVAGAVSKAYGFIAPYDGAGLSIQPYHYAYVGGTTTTLAQALNPGDTTIKLTSAANWYGQTGKPAGSGTSWRAILWWDFVDTLGKAWPIETYSRNHSGYDYWADGGVDLATNTITLRAPYSGPARAAGTPLSNANSGGTYLYMPSLTNGTVPEAWTAYGDVYSAGIMAQPAPNAGRGASVWSTGLPPGTAKLKLGWLLNYAPTSGKHAIAAVSFSDSSAAKAAADAAQSTANTANTTANAVTTLTNGWKFTGKTTINGGAIEADSIKAAQIAAGSIGAKQLLVADTSNMAEVNEQADGAVSYGSWKHVVETVSGVRWSKRDNINTNGYFMFRNQTGPVPLKTGDRIRLTFEAFADAAVTPGAYLWTYGSTSPYVAMSAAPTPPGGTAWPTTITTTAQSFAYEVVVPTLTDQTAYLIGLSGVTARDVKVRNVRAYRMGAGELIVDGSITAKQIKANTITTNELATDVLTVGNVTGLKTRTDLVDGWVKTGKTTIDGGKIEADSVTALQVKANSIGVKHLAVGDMSNLAELNEQVEGVVTWGGWKHTLETVSGAPWSKRDLITDQWFMFRNKYGPLPYKTGDKIRLTFEAFADAAVTATPTLYSYGAGTLTNAFTVAPTPAGGTAWPSQITTVAQAFAWEVTVGAITDHATFLIGLWGVAGRNVRVRNVRAYVMGAGELIVDGSIEGKHIKAGTVDADRIIASTLTIGKVTGLQGALDGKEVAGAAAAAQTAAATDAQSKADAAKAAAITAAASDAQAKADAAEAAALAAAATDAQAKADAAEGAAKTAAAADAQSKADAAKAAAITAAASDAQAKADAAVAAAAADASTKATNAKNDAITDATTKYDTARQRVNQWTFSGQTKINGGEIQADTIDGVIIKAHTIGADQLVVGGITNLVPNGAGEWGGLGGLFPAPFTFDSVDKPDGVRGVFDSTAGQGTYTPPNLWWELPDKNSEYLVEVWVKADKPNSRMYVELRDQNGAHAATCTAITGEASSITTGVYPIENLIVPTVWTKYVAKVVAKDGVTRMRVGQVYFNHSGGTETGAVQSIAIRVRGRGTGRLLVDGSIEAKHIKANAVKADAIEVGAIDVQHIKAGVLRTNMVGDPSFEEAYALPTFTTGAQGPTHQWRVATSGPGTLLIVRETARARSGSKRLTFSAGTGADATSKLEAFSPAMLVQPDKTYRVSWYAVATGAGATTPNVPKLTVEAIFGPTADALDPATPTAVSEGVTNPPYSVLADITSQTYERGSGDITIPTGQTNLYCALRFTATGNVAATTIMVDDVSMVEQGGGASELTAAGLRLFDEDGDEDTALVTNRPSRLTVAKDGLTLATVTEEGNASFQLLEAQDDLVVRGSRVFGRMSAAFGSREFNTSSGWEPGRDFEVEPIGIVEAGAGGVVAHQPNVNTPTTQLLAAGSYVMLAQVMADLEMGRMYSVRTSPYTITMPTGAVGALVLRYTSDGTNPTPSSSVLARHYVIGAGNAVSVQIADRPIAGSSGQRDFRIAAMFHYYSGSGALTPAGDAFFMTVYDEGYGYPPGSGAVLNQTVQASGSAPVTTAKKTYVSTWAASGSQTRRGSSASLGANTINPTSYTGSTKTLAGYYSGSNGNQATYIEFAGANSTGGESNKSLNTVLTGATVSKVELYVKNSTFYGSGGGQQRFGIVDGGVNGQGQQTPITGLQTGSTWAQPAASMSNPQSFTVGQGRWITLPSGAATNLKNGNRLVMIGGNSLSSSKTYYSGWANHAASSGKPLLRVTYTR